MKANKVKTYEGRLMAGRPCAGQRRYVAAKRTALDGRVWWTVFDHKTQKYIAGFKSATRKRCEAHIAEGIRKGWYKVSPSDYEGGEAPREGKRIYSVAVYWTVQRSYEVEAESKEEAQRKIQEKVDKGDVCVWTDGFEAGDDVTVETQGVEKQNGEWEWFPPKGE